MIIRTWFVLPTAKPIIHLRPSYEMFCHRIYLLTSSPCMSVGANVGLGNVCSVEAACLCHDCSIQMLSTSQFYNQFWYKTNPPAWHRFLLHNHVQYSENWLQVVSYVFTDLYSMRLACHCPNLGGARLRYSVSESHRSHVILVLCTNLTGIGIEDTYMRRRPGIFMQDGAFKQEECFMKEGVWYRRAIPYERWCSYARGIIHKWNRPCKQRYASNRY